MAKGGFRGGMPGGMNQAAMIKQAQKMQQATNQLSINASPTNINDAVLVNVDSLSSSVNFPKT